MLRSIHMAIADQYIITLGLNLREKCKQKKVSAECGGVKRYQGCYSKPLREANLWCEAVSNTEVVALERGEIWIEGQSAPGWISNSWIEIQEFPHDLVGDEEPLGELLDLY